MEKYIVGEASVNWMRQQPNGFLLSQKFEKLINTNHERGYKLIDWKMSTSVANGVLNETIIAIFERYAEKES